MYYQSMLTSELERVGHCARPKGCNDQKRKGSIPCPKGGIDMNQIKQVNAKIMCYVSYHGRKSIGRLPVYIKYKWIKYCTC